ncbi:MAG: hypothetical protein HGA38_02455 [Candidatus Moranbacteria bacterium]|nr:hypothetical protein [Candidatus Moranbacteria bacterium]NTW45749.1 hypothetical protein [Candidatus Moranbacteria bacterium]
MKTAETASDQPSRRFLSFALGVIIFSWSAYALATAGLFARPVVLAVFGVFSIISSVLLIRFLLAASGTARLATAAIIVFIAGLLIGTAPTIFSGRDQGSIADAAAELSTTGSSTFSDSAVDTFFEIYGPGRALNFPGFFYGEDGFLRSQFPESYISWLAAFHSVFGIEGFVIGNGFLFFLTLLSIFMLVRELSDDRSAVLAVILSGGSFLLPWFVKSTLSENLGAFLFIFLSFSLVGFLRRPGTTGFVAVVLTATLLALTRIEGFAILAIAFGLLYLPVPSRRFLDSHGPLFRIAPFVFSASAALSDFLPNISRYALIGKAFLHDVSAGENLPVSTVLADKTGTALELWRLLHSYGLFPIAILGFAGIAVLILRRNRTALVPALLAAPTFLYLLDPNITGDHPWMLRRLAFSVWPALIVSATVALREIIPDRPTTRFLPSAAVACLLFFSLPPTLRTFAFSENRDLLAETARLAESVGSEDLVLVDREATGDPFAIPSGPLRFLFGKKAAYCFNPDDIAKIPSGRYRHLYLLVTEDSLGRWSEVIRNAAPVATFRFHTERLGPSPLSDPAFPEISERTVESTLIRIDPTI